MKHTFWNRFSVGSFVLAAFFASGCGQPPVTQPEDHDGGASEAPPGPRSLGGSAQALFRDNKGTITPWPINLHADYFSANFANEDGSWRTVPGIAHEDGTFEIAEAGDGQYWLRIFDGSVKQDMYVLTDRSSVDLNIDAPGRGDAVYVDNDSTLVLFQNVDGLDPWKDYDGLMYVSGNLGYARFLGAWPPSGSTSTTLSQPWGGAPLADASKGDDITLVQLRYATDESGTFGYETTVRAATLTGITMQSGEVNTINATLQPLTPETYPLHWKRSAFTELGSQIHPTFNIGPVAQGFAVEAMPGGGDRGSLLRDLPPVVSPDLDALTGFDDLKLDLAIASPFPKSWWVNLYVVYFEVDLPVPGDPNQPAVGMSASIGETFTGMPDANGSVKPMISPARDVKLGGKTVFEDQQKVGLTPTLSWTAPEIGKADGYVVSVYEWEGIDDGVASLGERAVLMVPGDVTEVKLPPTVLRSGHQYVIQLRATQNEGLDVRAHGIYQEHLPFAWADLYTNTFSP